MVEYRRATEAERRHYGVEWRVTGSEWRIQLPAGSYTYYQHRKDTKSVTVTRAQATAKKERRHEGLYSMKKTLPKYAKALGISVDEAAARVRAQAAASAKPQPRCDPPTNATAED